MSTPWMELEELAPLFGVTPDTAKNKIAFGTFEVPTYKLGKKIVADRLVVDAFFDAKRQAGLRRLEKTTSG
jgi:hypothetical protein